MLSKQRCPHTGIVNYFTEADPFVSVGSIVRAGNAKEFHWRLYDAVRTISGIAADMRTAELRIKSQYRQLAEAGRSTNSGSDPSARAH